MSNNDKILNINKPPNISSNKVLSIIKGITKIKKVGHTGTLDPLAEGVLVVCTGKCTKLSESIMAQDKEYRAVIKLGVTTATQDSEGEILSEKEVNLSEEQIKEAVNSFQGEIVQIPPMYSAIKHKGKKLYELARAGIEVERKPRKVTIHKIDIINITKDEVTILISCSKGTYIRTLAEDIGNKLGVGAYLKHLVRTKNGEFCIEDSITIEEFRNHFERGGTIEQL